MKKHPVELAPGSADLGVNESRLAGGAPNLGAGDYSPSSRPLRGLALAAAAGIAAAAGYRWLGEPPSHEAVASVLAEAARSGRVVAEIVKERGIRPLDWARAVQRELGDAKANDALAGNAAAQLGASADQDLRD